MHVQLLEVGDDRWDDALARSPHDVYHLPGWASASATLDGGSPCAVFVSAGDELLLIPALRRPVDGSLWDLVSPYGYSGPVCSSNDARFRSSAMATATSHLAANGGVSWFIRLHPLLDAGWSTGPGCFVDHGRTVSIDLRKGVDQLERETRSGHRSEIRRARRAGARAALDEGFEALPDFIRLYALTMERVRASSYHRFADEYFAQLRDVLGPRLLLWVARLGDQVIGASLFTAMSGSGLMQYHLSASDPEHLHLQPSKLILDAARGWGRSAGFRRLHLGGGVGGADDQLFRFKAGFSPDTHGFRTQRIVLRSDVYDELVRARGGYRAGGFFPAYRAPRAAGEGA